MGRSYSIGRGYSNVIYKTDNIEKFTTFLRELLSEDNAGVLHGTEYEVKISDPDYDSNENENQE